MTILGNLGTRATPQSEPIPGRTDMVANSAGGYVFQAGDWDRLDRFLVLGVDAGTYYVGRRELAVDNLAVVLRCLNTDATRTVNRIVAISEAGRAPSNDPALFALAAACAHPEASRYALRVIGDVARTGTHLFHFAQMVEQFRGWGRGLRRGVAAWYEDKSPESLAYQAVKYRQRDGWTHRDIIRLAHPEARDEAHAMVYDFMCGRYDNADGAYTVGGDDDELRTIVGFERAQAATDPTETAAIVRDYRLPWEALKPEHLGDPHVWYALIEADALPLGALTRNLARLTNLGVITRGLNGSTTAIAARLGDPDEVRRSRLHPLAVLNALCTYRDGHGDRGNLTWDPVPLICDALDGAFYEAFGNVTPAGKRTVLALDVSGSMGQAIANTRLDCYTASAAMAMVTSATEPVTIPVAFAADGAGYSYGRGARLRHVDLSRKRRLDDVCRETRGMAFGGTDCSLPMRWALDEHVDADTFVIYTDNETWAGEEHPTQALARYRQRTGINARLVVVGMTSTGFTIADPTDLGQLDVVGFDTATPGVISSFSAGSYT